MITRFAVDNFKSLKGIDIELHPVNFIAGPNASGKSNFAEALDFISHIFRENLRFAVAEKGGFYNICHRRQRRAKGGISFTVAAKTQLPVLQVESKNETIQCDFTLKFTLRASGDDIRADFYVDSESLQISLSSQDKSTSLRIAHVTIERGKDSEDRPAYNFSFWPGPEGRASLAEPLKQLIANLEAFTKTFPKIYITPERQNLLLSGLLKELYPLSFLANELAGIRVFQLSPRIARQPAAPSIHGELGRRGENLASAVDQMRLTEKEGFATLSSWIREVVPSLSHVIPDYTETKQLGLFFQEKGVGSRWYAEDISDGTIMSLALFFALLAKNHRVVVIEEPENTLHPWILQKFIDRCREQSTTRQIIITSHSPIVIAQAKPNELLLAERNEGLSSIKPALQVEQNLESIIRNDLLDLGAYWLSGGLGAVPESPDMDQNELFGNGLRIEEET